MRHCVEKKGSFSFVFQSFNKYECEDYVRENGLRGIESWQLSMSEDEDGEPETVMLLIVEPKGDDVEIVSREGVPLCRSMSMELFQELFAILDLGHEEYSLDYNKNTVRLGDLSAEKNTLFFEWAKKNELFPI